ncbi:MAG TPA: lactate utilization protein [Candidatus Limnocylindria bacterium]|jgi:L-lactate dehydrogenase complex protein LldG|nr:lactate utilization protein [Candidatus Limnocylindria bacterium]
MTEREKILGRVREALTLSAPMPGAHHGEHQPSTFTFNGRPVQVAQQWLPDGGATVAEQLERFNIASIELKTDFHVVPSLAVANVVLATLRDGCGWKKIAAHHGPLTDAAVTALGLPTLFTDAGYSPVEMETCDAGISGCDALVAQTGSVIVTNQSAGGRALSVLPPHHVVLARQDQLVRDLTEGYALIQRLYAPKYPSMISVITGPSRTGDIERILVLGAHGPKKLTVICIANP